MTTPPYPLLEAPVKRSWLDRHGRWKVVFGGLLLIGVIGVFGAAVFTLVEASFRNSAVYQEALARARQNSQVKDRVGAPLQPGRVLQGQLNTSGSSGTARMAIPVTGPRGKATIYL